MEAGRRGRNLAVGVGYLLVVPVAIVLLPLLALGAVATNYRGIARRLSQLPGITHGGGAKAGVVAGAYALVLWVVVLSVVVSGSIVDAGPGAAESESGSAPESASEPPNETEADEAAAADEVSSDEENLSDGEIVILFETTVERAGIDLASVEQDDDVLLVEFHETATTEAEFFEQAGYLSGAYVGAVGEGLETDRMEATMLDRGDASPEVTWRVESEWAREYHDDESTIDDVIERSLATLEEADGEADGGDSQAEETDGNANGDDAQAEEADGDANATEDPQADEDETEDADAGTEAANPEPAE